MLENSNQMKGYSVAIRTLGTSGDLLKRELESLQRQTLKPDKVVIYIAEGYAIPQFRVADEQYVFVKKGMVAQQSMEYTEIDSDLILKLDDDVEFTNDNDAELLVSALLNENYDCVVVDTFKNHEMSTTQKMMAAFTNLVFPRFSHDYAFKVHANGSFSYINNPTQSVYPSESGAGPCSLWKKSFLLNIRIKDELWLDKLGFSYGDDQIIFYKLIKNGGRLAALFHSGIVHNDGKSSSGAYHKNVDKFRTRAKGQYFVWHRSIYSAQKTFIGKLYCSLSLLLKDLWLIPVHCIAAVKARSVRVPWLFVKGTIEGIRYTMSDTYKSLPPFILK